MCSTATSAHTVRPFLNTKGETFLRALFHHVDTIVVNSFDQMAGDGIGRWDRNSHRYQKVQKRVHVRIHWTGKITSRPRKDLQILRSGAFRHWEPIFIGTNRDPVYDERLTWEGRADKMVIFVMTMTILAIIIMMTWKTWMNIIQIVMVLMRTFVQMTETMLTDPHNIYYISILQVQGVKLCLMRYFSLLHQTSSKQSLWCDIWYIIYDIGFRYEFHVLDNAFLVHAPGVKTVQQRDRQMKPAKVDNPAWLWDPKNLLQLTSGVFHGVRVSVWHSFIWIMNRRK